MTRPDPSADIPEATAAFDDAPAPDPAAAVPLGPPEEPGELGRLGRFRVLREIGRGGMGAVFLAEDPQLRRKVALKVMLPKAAANPRAKGRFVREAQAQAAVEHDHVVPIYQVGEEGGVPFIAMPLLKGTTLAAALRANPRPPLGEVVRIGREVAEGLAAAHDIGLVHRDIKPANVWLEGDKLRVRILDFGLARSAADDSADADEPLTADGAVVGTPHYMSPEQARGEAVDARTDLFSLGVLLYQLATGELPFRGPNTMAVLTALAVDTPPPPSAANAAVPPALDDLIARLMSKKVNRRPASAEAVAAELRRIEAELVSPVRVVSLPSVVAADRPADPWQEIETTAADTVVRPAAVPPRRRFNPWILAAVLVAGVAVAGVVQIVRVSTPKGTLVIDSDDPDIEIVVKHDGAVLIDRTRKREIELKVGPNYTIELAEKKDGLRLSTDKFEITKGKQTTVRVRVEKPAVAARPKDAAKKDAGPREAPAIVLPTEATAITLTLDGKTGAAGGKDGVIYLIDTAAGKVTGQLDAKAGPVRHLAFTPDGKWLAATGGGLRVWNVETKQPRVLDPVAGVLTCVSATDGTIYGTQMKSGWDPETGDVRVTLSKAMADVGGVAAVLPRSGHVFVEGSRRYGIADPKTGTVLRTWTWSEGWPRGVAASPDGSRVAVSSGLARNYGTGPPVVGPPVVGPQNAVAVFDVDTGKIALMLTGHESSVERVAYSPDGSRIASASFDGTARVWDAVTGEQLHAVKHNGVVTGVAFAPDGRTLYTAGFDKAVRVWELPPPPPLPREVRVMTLPKSTPANRLSLSPDGSALAVGGNDGTVYVFDPHTGTLLDSFPGHGGRVIAVAFSPDGHWIAAGGSGGAVNLWDWKEKKRHRLLGRTKGGDVWSIAFSADGKTVYPGSTGAAWDFETGEAVAEFAGENGWGRPIPGTDTFATSSWPKKTVTFFDAKTGAFDRRHPIAGGYRDVIPSPDGKLLAVAEDFSPNTIVELFDWPTLRGRGRLTGHVGIVFTAAWSPRGDWVATAGDDGTARVYEVQSTRLVAELKGHTKQVFGVAFSPDGRTLYTSAADGTVRVWALPASGF